MKALVIGGCSWDTLIQTDEIQELKDDLTLWSNHQHETVGGTGAGKALCLDTLGVETTLVTTMAEDQYRKNILSFFDDTAISIYPIPVEKNTTHTNIMHGQGKRISVFTNHSSEVPEADPTVIELIKQSDVVFLNINEFCLAYVDACISYSKLTVVDLHDYDPPNPYHQEFIRAAHIITVSDAQLPDSPSFMNEMINDHKQLMIVTKGRNGLVALDNKKNQYMIPAYMDLPFVDSNGAGDSLCSGFITSYLQSNNTKQSLRFGAVCGAYSCASEELYHRSASHNVITETLSKWNEG